MKQFALALAALVAGAGMTAADTGSEVELIYVPGVGYRAAARAHTAHPHGHTDARVRTGDVTYAGATTIGHGPGGVSTANGYGFVAADGTRVAGHMHLDTGPFGARVGGSRVVGAGGPGGVSAGGAGGVSRAGGTGGGSIDAGAWVHTFPGEPRLDLPVYPGRGG